MMISSLIVRNGTVKRRLLTVSLALTQQQQQQRIQQQARGLLSISSSIILDPKNDCSNNVDNESSKKYNSNRIVHLRSTSKTNGHLFDGLQTTQQLAGRRLYSTTTVIYKRSSTGSSKKGDSKSKKKILKGDYATIVADGEDDSDDDDDNFVIKTKSGLETLNYYNLSGDGTVKNDFMEKYTEDDLDKIIEEEEKLMELKIKEKNSLFENWKPGQRRKHKQSTYNIDDFEYLNEDDYDDDDYDDEGNYIASEEKKLANELKFIEKQKNTIREWRVQKDKRCGLIGIKVGMIPVYDTRQWGIRYPCTVLYIDNNTVLGHKTIKKHGYSAIQIAFGERKKKNIGTSVLGQYQHLFQFIDPKANDNIDNDNDIDEEEEEENNDDESTDIQEESNETTTTTKNDIATTATTSSVASDKIERKHPPHTVREFRITADIDDDCYIPVGTVLHASHFVPGQNIDIVGTSKGKGFQGGMKLHNFKGMPASHGTSLSHRAIGSVGQCQDPGRVFKGKKMPGRMGSNRVTIQNNRILKIDRGRNLIYVIGTVPGQKGSLVEIRDSIKKPFWGRSDKVIDGIVRPPIPTSIYDTSIDGCGLPGYEVYMPIPTRDPLLPGTIDDDEVKSYNYQLKEPPALNES